VFSNEDLLTQVVVERMLAGVPTRRHQDVADPLGAELDARSKATSRSAVSRRFRRTTEKALAELLSRDLADLDVAVVMIDGIEVAGSCREGTRFSTNFVPRSLGSLRSLFPAADPPSLPPPHDGRPQHVLMRRNIASWGACPGSSTSNHPVPPPSPTHGALRSALEGVTGRFQ